MKNQTNKYKILLLITLFIFGGCTDDFKEINTNPATYSQSNFDPNYLLTNAQLHYTGSADFAYDTWRSNLIYCATMVQGLSTVVGYWAGDKYLLNEAYLASYWGSTTVGAYAEQVKPITDLVEFTRDQEQYKNLHQVARIMRALIMQRITDIYGDAPYFEAGMGYYTGIITPKYDKQQDIYADLLKEVEEATAALDAGADRPTGDVFYGGDIEKWKRFGNSLLLRIAMRLSKVDPETAKTYVTKVQGKTMTSNEDNAFVAHDEAGARATQNRNSQVLLGDGGQENYYVKWSDTFIDLLKTNDDPRLGEVAVTQLYLDENGKVPNPGFVTDPAVQKGLPNGLDLSGVAERDARQDPSFTGFENYSSPNPGMIKRDGVTFVMTYGQTELLLADAAQRWGIGNAEEHYKAGVTAAMTYLSQYDPTMEVQTTAAEDYLASNPYNPANGLEIINTQYWALCNTMLDFYESWINWRRSGYPVLTPVVYPNNATNGTIPRRFPYPITEATANPDNLKAAQDALANGDKLTSRVWWDVE